MINIINIVFTVISCFIISSCSKMQTKVDLAKSYKMDIQIQTRNPEKTFEGVGTIPRKDLHTLEFIADDKIDILFIRSCSREEVLRESKSVFNKKKYIYNYKPNEVELFGNCPLKIHALNKNGLYSAGYLDVEDESTTLPAYLICGGVSGQNNGVSTCQERKGSTEMIRFDVEVLTDPDPGCELESGNRGKVFEFKIKNGACNYDFVEIDRPHRIHRLSTHGYEEIRVGI